MVLPGGILLLRRLLGGRRLWRSRAIASIIGEATGLLGGLHAALQAQHARVGGGEVFWPGGSGRPGSSSGSWRARVMFFSPATFVAEETYLFWYTLGFLQA